MVNETKRRWMRFLSMGGAVAWAIGAGQVSASEMATGEMGLKKGLTFEARVSDQSAIEQIYQMKRAGEAQTLPASAQFPREIAEQRVWKYLAMNVLLEARYKQSITEEMLNAELGRITSQTQDPSTLREIFAALGNSPHRVKESLVRPLLVERLLRPMFAYDDEIHKAVRGEVRALRARIGASDFDEAAKGGYFLAIIKKGEPGDSKMVNGYTYERYVDEKTFNAFMRDVPSGGVGEIAETETRVYFQRFVSAGDESLEAETFFRDKPSFDEWLEAASPTREELTAWSPSFMSLASVREVLPEPRAIPASCAAGSWEEFGPPEPRFGHAAVWTGTEMIVWGGYNGNGMFYNSGFSYNPITDFWTPITRVNAPEGRFQHSAVWTGTEMLIWGGHNGIAPLRTGGRYNPSTKTWAATPGNLELAMGAPEERIGHSAVWTGTEMIVWGGWKNYTGSELVTGGRYNPTSGTWLPMANGTLPRIGCTTVWTGTEMIVWGGYNSVTSALYGDGERYNPVTNSWQSVGTKAVVGVTAPTARRDHVAVWSGTEMLVWGGWTGSPGSVVATGAHYNPATSTWTKAMPLPSGGAFMGDSANNTTPERYESVAFWTGAEMLIWGGLGSSNAASDGGGRYNPSTGAWAGVPVSSFAPARRNIVGVWSGTAMMLWDGRQIGSAMLPMGGTNLGTIYNPVLGSVNPIGLNGAPSARHGHSATWTGAEMIVWGGIELQSSGVELAAVSTGGKFNPALALWSATQTSLRKQCGGCCDLSSCLAKTTCANVPGCPLVMCSAPVTRPVFNYSNGRVGHTAVWATFPSIPGKNPVMLIIGGIESSPDPTITSLPGSFVFYYTPAFDRWSVPFDCITVGYCKSAAPEIYAAPSILSSRRSGHAAVWALPSEEAVYTHGWDLDYASPTYGPVTSTYSFTSTFAPDGFSGGTATCVSTPLPAAGIPSARYQHTLVWNGAKGEAIVWGGYAEAPDYAFRGDGGAYNVAAKSWTTLPAAGAPSSRSLHTAVWSGSSMVVWGGRCGSGCGRDDGGVYTPATGWASIPAGILSKRYYHTSIWTGTDMITWGGYETDTKNWVSTGASYDLAAKTWTPTATLGAPLGRFGHTATWVTTGKSPHMVVWGGWVQGTVFSQVGANYWVTCAAPPPVSGSSFFGEAPSLQVSSVPGADASASLQWAPSCTASDFSVYKGRLDLLRQTGTYNHAPASCSTGSVTAASVSDDGAGEFYYYLVTPHGAADEGSLGRDSAGVERPRPAATCYPPNITHCP